MFLEDFLIVGTECGHVGCEGFALFFNWGELETVKNKVKKRFGFREVIVAVPRFPSLMVSLWKHPINLRSSNAKGP